MYLCVILFILVPIKTDKDENTNTFLSSSLQKTPSSDQSIQEKTTPVSEEIKPLQEDNNNQTISSIVSNDVQNEMEFKNPSISEKSEQKKEIISSTPSAALNPDATPFVLLPASKLDENQSISTGEETDDEIDSNDTPVTSGK